jgi:hypothetical protein
MTSEDRLALEALAAAGGLFVRLARGEKRPLGAGWQNRGTAEVGVVSTWLRSGGGVGLLLGPGTGLVDVEADDEAGEAVARELGLDLIPCPTWRSARGVHRLFRWTDELPSTAVAHVGPLEVRIGGRAAQSVLPPSRHPTGIPYRWETSPVDVAVPEIPASVLEALFGQRVAI